VHLAPAPEQPAAAVYLGKMLDTKGGLGFRKHLRSWRHERRHGGEKALRVGMPGARQDVVDRALLDA
jgi:hypothetical protein